MANKLYEEEHIRRTADAIRRMNGLTDKYDVSEFEGAILELGGGTAPKQIEWHQCPEKPREFITNVMYDPSDYTVSEIENYAPDTPLVSNYKPIGYEVDGIVFYNEVPNQNTDFRTGKSYGTVKPLDQIRYINTPSAPNVRDLGGWACDGGMVKYGLLFRGGEPSLSDREVLVGELGIRYDLNLRGTEATWDVSPLGDDVYFVKADVYNWYTVTDNEAWRINLRCVFDAVTHNEPVLFHCSAGADRTGTLACVLEGLLGMSQSDIDKDYELTSFYTGTATDNHSRRRNESEWTRLINQINTYDGETFRDKCVDFVVRLGFTAKEINAYRKAMIDGNPADIVPSIADYTVVKSLPENIEIDNDNQTVKEYQKYEANIKCVPGVVIGGVKVTMGGVDVTDRVFSGTETNLNRKVTYNLTECSTTNIATKVIDGQSYCTEIKASAGYKIESASVKMGGVDVSKYYKNGVIAIPSVTGDLEIEVVTVGEATTESNVMVVQSENINKRISGLGNIASYNGCFVTDPIEVDLTEPSQVTFNKALTEKMMSFYTEGGSNLGQSKVELMDANKNTLVNWYINSARTGYNGAWAMETKDSCLTGDLCSLLQLGGVLAGTIPSAGQVSYVRFCLHISNEVISESDLSGLEVLMAV